MTEDPWYDEGGELPEASGTFEVGDVPEELVTMPPEDAVKAGYTYIRGRTDLFNNLHAVSDSGTRGAEGLAVLKQAAEGARYIRDQYGERPDDGA